jgi:hypothetical protein
MQITLSLRARIAMTALAGLLEGLYAILKGQDNLLQSVHGDAPA